MQWAGFLPLNFMRSTKLLATTKLSAEHETPPIANVLLCVRATSRSEFIMKSKQVFFRSSWRVMLVKNIKQSPVGEQNYQYQIR